MLTRLPRLSVEERRLELGSDSEVQRGSGPASGRAGGRVGWDKEGSGDSRQRETWARRGHLLREGQGEQRWRAEGTVARPPRGPLCSGKATGLRPSLLPW